MSIDIEKFIDQVEYNLLTCNGRYPKGSGWIKLDPNETEKISAVYLLGVDEKVLYVGQSKDVVNRVKTHRKNGIIPFTKCYYLAILPEYRSELESFLIWSYKPQYNKAYPPMTDTGKRAYAKGKS